MVNGGVWMIERLRNLRADTKGVTVIEYVLIAGLISVVAISVIAGVGTSVKKIFSTVNNALTSA
jgi:Flp pilus assembly pilin Flp